LNSTCQILYIEDSPEDARLFEIALRDARLPYNLRLLTDGETALAFCREKPFIPDVFAIDLGLPKVDGLTVLQAVKADSALQGVPTLVFVQPGTPNFQKAVELRADVCVPKPMALDQYAALTERITRLWSSGPPSEVTASSQAASAPSAAVK
jgi:CheY-like chemotaxis protein